TFGMDQPLFAQYLTYLGGLLRGDFGQSYVYLGQSVNEIIGQTAPVSFELGLWALLVALGLGVPVGIVAAVRKNTPADYLPMSAAMVGICLPTFVIGPILALVFGVQLGWFSVSGWFGPGDRVLPALTLGLAYAAWFARLTRTGMLDVLSQDYIRTARAKGLPERRVILKHAIKGGLLPVIAYMGPALAGIISGSFVVETIFQIPGLGRQFVQSALNRDYTLILGTVIFFAALIILLNLLVDIVLTLLNPRARE
ncbi:MAG: ABC transporter permease, partial [Verrucomicrobiota bacterium]